MGKVGVRGGAMPMFFLGWDVDHIAHGDLLLRGLGGNNAGPLRDEQDLITAMGVHFIAHPRREVHDP
jgi:hypothetical protein